MRPIAIFYHCLFWGGEPLDVLEKAVHVVSDQMAQLKASGLEDAARQIHVGVNGDAESRMFRHLLSEKADVTYHGLQCKNENRTCVMMEEWVKNHPGWNVLYLHAKGSTHALGSSYGQFADNWRHRMMHHCVSNWHQCVSDLEGPYEAVGCHWLTGQGHDRSQHYFAGTFFWVRSEFWSTIPSLYNRARIKDSGIDALESRYEAEVIIGNGPRLPCVRSYYDGPIGT